MADAAENVLVQNADGHEEVAAHVKPSVAMSWDLPSGSVVRVLDAWVECEFKSHRGFIKTKNFVDVAAHAPGDLLEVRDSFKANKETCMRRHAEQDSTKGNVLCFVPNGPEAVKLIERWVECKWRGHRGFVKARHVQPAPLEPVLDPDSTGSPPKVRGSVDAPYPAAASSSSGIDAAVAEAVEVVEPPAKKAKISTSGRPRCRYGKGCYQKNEAHRCKFCHPGDDDWEVGDATMSVAKSIASAATAAAPVPEALAAPISAAPVEAVAGPAAEEPLKLVPLAEPAAVIAEVAGAASLTAPVHEPPPAPSPASVAEAVMPAAVPDEPVDEESRDCSCCFDSVAPDGCILCPGKAHFFCKGCLENFLVAFKTAEYAEQKKGKGRAMCPMKDSEIPFADSSLAAFVPQEVFDEYLHIRIKVVEKGIQEEFEKEHNAKIDELKEKLAKASGDSEQLELDKHRLRIMDDIFTLKCPRCKLAFLDYDGCSAVTCGGCKCGFCSFCLEDCGKDAHAHFFKHGSKCPNEDGPLFVEHKQWVDIQNKRKAALLCEYLATVPEALRKRVAELCAPDAKDLGVVMPEDLSGPALAPEAHGLVRWKLKVPRKLRARLAKQSKGLFKDSVALKMPEAAAMVRVVPADGEHVTVRKVPTGKPKGKNVGALPTGHDVRIEDEWVEFTRPKEKISHGFVKAKHVVGRALTDKKAVLRDVGGHGGVMARKEAKQDEGKNSLGFLDDGVEIKTVQHWVECSWDGPPFGHGFIAACDIPEDDVLLQGPAEDCSDAVVEIEKALGLEVHATAKGKGGKAKGRGKGAKGRGRG